MLEKLFKTEFGQKVLLFLAPFFLSPQEFKNTVAHQKVFTKNLHLSAFAPFLGASFLTGATAALFRTLSNKGISFEWILNYQSAGLIFTQAFLLTWLGYSAALSRYGAGKILDYFSIGSGDFKWPLAFWLSYYGGILIVLGGFFWLVIGALSLHFSYITGGIIFICLVVIGIILRLEIKIAQEKNRQRLHYQDWSRYTNVTLGLFILCQIPMGILVFFL